MGNYFGLRGQALNWAIGAVAGCDFLLFGYGRPSSLVNPSKASIFIFFDRQTAQIRVSWAAS